MPFAAAAVFSACNDAFDSDVPEQIWGFVNIDARKAGDGSHVTVPDAFFLRAILSAVPNAAIRLDSCVETAYSANGGLSGVTFLEAGTPLLMTIGGRTDTIPRTPDSDGVKYIRPASQPIPYVPGDSVVASVAGAVGGFPGGEIRAKTAEAFTMDPIEMPVGTNDIPIRWSAASNQDAVMILEFPFSTIGGTLNRQILCSFDDDGQADIPFRQYQNWFNNAGSLELVLATRLRTAFAVLGPGLLEVISTYSVPTPAP